MGGGLNIPNSPDYVTDRILSLKAVTLEWFLETGLGLGLISNRKSDFFIHFLVFHIMSLNPLYFERSHTHAPRKKTVHQNIENLCLQVHSMLRGGGGGPLQKPGIPLKNGKWITFFRGDPPTLKGPGDTVFQYFDYRYFFSWRVNKKLNIGSLRIKRI